MFPTALSSVDTTVHRQTFLQNMDIFLTISRKDIWQIRRGGQGTNRVFRGNRNGSWEQIWGITGSLRLGGGLSSMMMVGRYIARLPQSAVNGLLKHS